MQRKEKDNRPLRRLVVYSLNGGKINVFCLHFLRTIKLKVKGNHALFIKV